MLPTAAPPSNSRFSLGVAAAIALREVKGCARGASCVWCQSQSSLGRSRSARPARHITCAQVCPSTCAQVCPALCIGVLASAMRVGRAALVAGALAGAAAPSCTQQLFTGLTPLERACVGPGARDDEFNLQHLAAHEVAHEKVDNKHSNVRRRLQAALDHAPFCARCRPPQPAAPPSTATQESDLLRPGSGRVLHWYLHCALGECGRRGGVGRQRR